MASRIAVAGKDAWVTTTNAVIEFNVARGTVLRKVSSKSDQFEHALAIAAVGSHLWVTNTDGNSITELSVPRGSLVRVIQ